MTWLDGVLILIVVMSISMGARLGSLWTGACLAGGFAGAFLADVYAYPVSGMIGPFPGSFFLSALVLFAAGCVAALVPGWILSRLSAGLFLGVIDSAFGFITGAAAGICAITLCVLLVVPLFPQIERTRAWKKSKLVRPFQTTMEEFLSRPQFRLSDHWQRWPEKAKDLMKNS